ncbi:YbfB/YjiJ family MFS transporter [Synechococcus sp. CC9311]|uniref:YbfB/YjiJ family MFS transporter n=1 Tax=Synechococcus sp. (strain CC9311) TaxID=64471 RepID=UPI0000DDAD59|nr:YbfB/YjiJ family MFS transporter [Synechococcus sp. CC9311]ABI47293.1 possible MFS family transporter, putative [Synechococcus sp. CC9311]
MRFNFDHWSLDLLGGCFGIAIGLGLVRFDFGIIGSLMVDANWINIEDIGRLAAINMFGYLAGAIQQAYIKRRQVSVRFVFAGLIVIMISIILEGRYINFTSQSILRLLCGWGAAQLVAGLPSLALERVPSNWRRQSTGVIMCGGGVGALLGAVAIGTFSPTSAPTAWNVLGLLTVFLSLPTLKLIFTNFKLQANFAKSNFKNVSDVRSRSKAGAPGSSILFIIMGFVFMQIGQVPVILYEPLIAIKKIGLTPMVSSNVDGLFGFGLIMGGLIPSITSSRLTTKAFLPLISLFGLLGVILFGATQNVSALSISILLIGIWDMMIGTLTIDRLGQLCNEELQRRYWASATSFGSLGFIIFSIATSQLSGTNINLVLVLGIASVVIHALLEFMQCLIVVKPRPLIASCGSDE